MEELKEQKIFSNKKIAPKNENNLVNLRSIKEDQKVNTFFPERKNLFEDNKDNILEKIIKIGIYLLVFLMPIFILPFSVETYEFNKTFLFVSVSSLLFVLWFLNGILSRKKLSVAKSSIIIPLFIFIAVIFASAIFGVDRMSSFIGSYGSFSDSVIFYFSFFILCFLGINLIAEKGAGVIASLLKISAVSSFVVALSSLLYWGGVHLPFLNGENVGFNFVAGDIRVLAIYLSVMIFVSLYDFSSAHKYKIAKVFNFVNILLTLCVLILIDWNLIWPIFFSSLLFSLLAGNLLSKNKSSHYSAVLPIFLLLFSLVLTASVVNFNKIKSGEIALQSSSLSETFKEKMKVVDSNNPNKEVVGFEFAKDIAMESLKDSPILGSGIGTYYYDFSKYRDSSFNYTESWNLRFGKAYNEFLEKLSTIGIAGFISYIFLLFFTFYLAFQIIKKDKRNIFILSSLFFLLIFQLLFLETTVIKFLWALLFIVVGGKSLPSDVKWVLDLKQKGIKNKGALSVIVIFAVLACGSLIFSIQSFRAEAKYKNAVSAKNINDLDINELEAITNINPYRSEYHAQISSIYAIRLQRFVGDADVSNQESLKQIQSESEKALYHAKRATQISPNNVALWENCGFVYRKMFEYKMDGADEWAINSFRSASALDSTNAVTRTEIGKLLMLQYLAMEGEERSGKLAEAKKEFEEAVKLKEDYPDALSELALVYFESGDKDNSAVFVEKASKQKGISPETGLQIGKIFYNLDDKEKAAAILSIVAEKKPELSDTHYILGIIYMEDKRNSEALAEFQKVLDLNPGNTEIMNKIKELEGLNNTDVKGEEKVYDNASDNTEETEDIESEE